MAHKVFISYKYSESKELRDKIISSLGNDAQYYNGEDGYSDDLSSYKSDTIKTHLKKMIFDTTVMVVIVSPGMKSSNWMEWEIEYALRNQFKEGRTSHEDGVICVVSKMTYPNYGYSDQCKWAKDYRGKWNAFCLFNIINSNRNNKKTWENSGLSDKENYNSLSNNYIDIVSEETFLKNPSYYIEKAYEKSQNIGAYNIKKQSK